MSRYISKHTGPVIDAAIDRAKADGAIDTLLQNNDPRNWGLDLSKSLTDANDATRNGFYTMTVGAANVPFDYGVLLVHNLGNTNYVHQELTGYLTGLKVCRGGKYNESTGSIQWEPWEWVNPPMVVGTEYRTTERYMSKPVYVKLIEFGSLPNDSQSSVSYTTESAMAIQVSAITSDGMTLPGVGGTYGYPAQLIEVHGFGNTVVITTHQDKSSLTANVFVKYYKTTD